MSSCNVAWSGLDAQKWLQWFAVGCCELRAAFWDACIVNAHWPVEKMLG
eukprot:CAMPEP_0172705032 /NCGR_PEP_ID=MMETSP1074-20121228/42109_1 /TAXON_ID=2916 /ORGANISM="Ceratium fusus, Strain PA161109" /LENGTH=48 /DNA_ID= /DNA_START= /DNA_END= /DNA_ORIENTATION=